MFSDASAIVAMLTDEVDGQELAIRMARSTQRMTSPIAIFQSVAALARKQSYSINEAREIIAHLLTAAEIDLIGIGAEQSEAALSAFERFGKGRHPAALNMGDCFAMPARLLRASRCFLRATISTALTSMLPSSQGFGHRNQSRRCRLGYMR